MRGAVIGFILALVFVSNGIAQKKNFKWGKLSNQEVAIKTVPFEQDAGAVMLHAKGRVDFSGGTQINIFKHFRIKILNERGLDEADVNIPFYSKDGWERVVNVRAQTINSRANGKSEITEVDKASIHTVDGTYESEVRIVFPAVKVGSVIEYQYTVLSKHVTYLEGWTFDHWLPTLKSEFSADIPPHLDYRYVLQGRKLLSKYRVEPTNTWELTNLPTLQDEGFVHSYLNYSNAIQFQLAGYYARNGMGNLVREEFATSWDDLGRELLAFHYSSYLNKNTKYASLISPVILGLSDRKKAEAIYNIVRTAFKWNGKERIFKEQTLNQFLESGIGSNAEINLLLTGMLRAADLKAQPGLLSTLENGNAIKGYPFLSQFNYLISVVEIDGKNEYLDATNKARPHNFLPARALTDILILEKNNTKWAKSTGYPSSSVESKIRVDLTTPSTSVFVNEKFLGYIAVDLRNELYSTKGELKNHEFLSRWDVVKDSSQITNLGLNGKPLITTANYLIDEKILEDRVILNLTLLPFIEESPFKKEKRQYPVEFDYPKRMVQEVTYVIPSDYKIVSMPEKLTMIMPDKSLSYSMKVTFVNDRITCNQELAINKTKTSRYKELRVFFDKVVSKGKSQLIIEKM